MALQMENGEEDEDPDHTVCAKISLLLRVTAQPNVTQLIQRDLHFLRISSAQTEAQKSAVKSEQKDGAEAP